MHVGLGPGVRSEHVEFVSGPSTEGAWLFAKEDLLITKVGGAGVALVLTSVRAAGGEVLTIKVERLDDRAEEDAAVAPLAAQPAVSAAAVVEKGAHVSAVSVPLQLKAHVRTRGDMIFTNTPWARVAAGLWIESFAIRPLEHFTVEDIEYKGLTGSGFETPWLSDEAMCGTQGLGVPLVGFAARFKRSCSKGAAYDVEYSGYFKSGLTAGPMRNGAPCRSTVANDPLEGIQMRIAQRASATVTDSSQVKNELPRTATRGPSFGRYRDDNASSNGNGVPVSSSANPTKRLPART
jgi:hypothetical protein